MNVRAILAQTGFWLVGLCLFMSGCISSKELVLYQATGPGKDTLTLGANYIPTIKAGDVLSVQVGSLSPEASAFFNPYMAMSAMGTSVQNSQTSALPYTPGYLVNESGKINLPILGDQLVQGLTTSQAAGEIRTKLLNYLKEPTVNVRNLNFHITVTGEVARPALYSIPNEQITLPEALGLAGDITIYGQRKNVLVIREENGKQTFNRIDLTKRDVFQSPFYHLHPNDVIYVEPGKSRVASADRFYQTVPIILSALSFIAIIISRR
ncbi:polysaccharide biosynthesis/export family protein [uncultured Fibrella sp.]|uniref:polysaccharide biosynthesis/export family protein n=1 Tax=uncultured Fibrella sp. TaxID=1284596 RepID=UPI0035C9B179